LPQFTFKLPGGKKVDVSDTPTDTQVLTFDSASDLWDAQDAGGGGAGWLSVYKTSSETITSDDTLTDDTDLQFSVDASSTYVGVVHFLVDGHSTPDLKYSFSVPVGATGSQWDAGNPTSLWTSGYGATVAASGAITDVTNVLINNAERWSMTPFVINTDTTAGTAALQWAQRVSSIEDTILVKGTWIIYKKVS